MSKTSWVIMKETTFPHYINIPSIHMVGFPSKREAIKECDRLNERSFALVYTIQKAKVFQPRNQ